MDPLYWLACAPLRPGIGYRPVGGAGVLLAIPPRWQRLGRGGLGTFKALVPRSRRGLAAIVAWNDGKRQLCWERGQALVGSEVEELHGLWLTAEEIPSSPGTSHRSAPLPRRQVCAFTEKLQRERNKRRSLLIALGYPGFDAPSLPWACFPLEESHREQETSAGLQLPPPGQRYPDLLFHHLMKNLGTPTFWETTFLGPETLDHRRRLGRSEHEMAALSHTQVILCGLGALGSEVAHLLAQEGVAPFLLVDGDLLLPGNVTRHRADLSAVGQPKVEAMRTALLRINPHASIKTVNAWIDDLVPQFTHAGVDNKALFLGFTGDEASECLLSDLARHFRTPAFHAWLEYDTRVLRLFRVLPERDPYLVELAQKRHLPFLPRSAPSGPAQCVEAVLPGSAANIHAAANFIVRIALDLIIGKGDEHNHWLFAPGGLDNPDPRIAPALRQRYGHAAFRLSPDQAITPSDSPLLP